jgi:hypothetical protein
MTIWTFWYPEKKKIDEIVETQEDEEVPQHRIATGTRSKLNRFYKRKHLRNKHICSQL